MLPLPSKHLSNVFSQILLRFHPQNPPRFVIPALRKHTGSFKLNAVIEKGGLLQRLTHHQNDNLILDSRQDDRGRRSIYRSAVPLNKAGNSQNGNIVYSIVPKEKSHLIANFLQRYHHTTEPMSVALGMNPSEIDGWLQRLLRKCMFLSLCDISVQAIDEVEQRRIGVLSSIVLDPYRNTPFFQTLSSYPDPEAHPVCHKMGEFIDTILKGIDPTESLGLSTGGRPPRILEHLYITVKREYSGQGISSRMIQLAESLAMNVINCRVAYCIATSEYAFRSFSRQGYKSIKEIRYADYTDPHGNKIFRGLEGKLGPHQACRVMLKELPEMQAYVGNPMAKSS